MKIIAKIHTPFPEKFSIPRQSGMTETEGIIIFEPEYRSEDALRGIEEYSHLWLIWKFSEIKKETWSPTVRPPRLGGNRRMGVFATRSPFRPNPIGLSSVKLLGKERTAEGWVLRVSGVDLMDGTPIYDIKPYLSFTDSHPNAKCGFADAAACYSLSVDFPESLRKHIDQRLAEEIIRLIAQDPRPAYINEPDRIYGMSYGGVEIQFKVNGDLATVIKIE